MTDQLIVSLNEYDRVVLCPDCGKPVLSNALQALTGASLHCPKCDHDFSLLVPESDRVALIEAGVQNGWWSNERNTP